ncbi:endonuclease VII [Mycobacterium phage MS810]
MRQPTSLLRNCDGHKKCNNPQALRAAIHYLERT